MKRPLQYERNFIYTNFELSTQTLLYPISLGHHGPHIEAGNTYFSLLHRTRQLILFYHIYNHYFPKQLFILFVLQLVMWIKCVWVACLVGAVHGSLQDTRAHNLLQDKWEPPLPPAHNTRYYFIDQPLRPQPPLQVFIFISFKANP